MRKAVEIPVEQLRELAAIGCTQDEIGRVFGLSQSAISRRLEKEPHRSAWEGGRAEGDMSLRRKQYEMAMNGNVVMLLWLGKNRLGQADKAESKIEYDSRVSVRYIAEWGRSDDEILRGCEMRAIEPGDARDGA